MASADPQTSTSAMDAISSQQRDFVRHYVVNKKLQAAAVEAGYSPRSAHATATRLIRNPKVIAAIREMEAEAQARAELTLDDIIAELRRVAFTGLGRFVKVTSDGDPYICLTDATSEDLDLLSEITVDDVVEGRDEDKRTIRKIKIKPMDRLNALVTLGKHFGLMNKAENEEVSSLTQALRDLAQRGSPQPFGARARK